MRVAIVTPSFFGYENAIADAFRRQGVDAELFDERPSNTSVSRAVLRLFPALMAARVRRHFEAILAVTVRRRFDALLIVKGENVPAWFVRQFRARNPDAVTLFYSFDALTNSSECLQLFPWLDHKYSFDHRDVASRGDLKYKPLFYAPEFARVRGTAGTVRTRHLASFVGTLHSDRYEFVRAVTASLPSPAVFAYFYSPARWYFALQKSIDWRVRRVRRADVSFTKMSRGEVAAVFAASRVVIDYQRPGQSGITMRTFEALASGAALVTSNAAVTSEPFYDATRILVLTSAPSEVNSTEVARWIDSLPPENEVPEGFDSYSIDAWVTEFTALMAPEAGR